MFVGREAELALLEEAYATDDFQMVVLYGRRRLGKTTLLEQFSKDKSALFFTAQIQADIDNLRDFSRAVIAFFDLPQSTPPFGTWLDALNFTAERAREQRMVLVFDELPYAAKSNPGLPSALQISIDHAFKNTSCLMVLCGSNQGFMESQVLGEKSPLYGRRTAQIKLKPFDYLDAAKMLPDCPPQELVSYYASLGGTPYYLSGVRANRSYIENMTAMFFSREGIMFDEPNMLMRQELREPGMYSSVMRAIACGAYRPSEIADRVGIPATSITPYLKTLVDLDLIERAVPFGEPESSKRSRYRIKDPAFIFWYRFVAPHASTIEGGLGDQLATRLLQGDVRTEYEGHLFERVCREWMLRCARKGRLPIQATAVSSWWGTDPMAREQADIDVVAADQIDKQIILGECKWKSSFDETEVLRTLKGRSGLIAGYENRGLYIFCKNAPSKASMAKAKESGDVRFVTADELYRSLDSDAAV